MSRFGLVAFVKARIDEDVELAELGWSPMVIKGEIETNMVSSRTGMYLKAPVYGHAWDSARLHREIDAKRARLALLDEAITEMDRLLADDDAAKIDQGVAIGRKEAALTAVKHDAAIHNDHPDYRDEWKP